MHFRKPFPNPGPERQHLNLKLLPPSNKENHVPNQCIDLHALNVVQRLQRLLDLPLVRLDVAHKDERVVLLNLLHRGFRIERVDEHLVRI